MLVVRGDAGIGKSRLLQQLIDEATGFRVVHATGIESEMELPFGGLHQLCASLLDRLDTLPAPQRDAANTAFGLASGSTPDRLLIGLAVLNLLSGASDDGPLLCVVDDAQWLDRASLQALSFVARRLLADSVALVFATRMSATALDEFPELIVEGMRDSDAHTLLSSVLRIPLDQRVRDRIVAETHGNPLALVEWPRGLTSADLAGGFAMPTTASMSGQIEESFRRRIAELPDPTQRFLTVAAAEPTGDAVIVWRAANALGALPHDLAPAIDAGLIEIGARVSFRHPLVRSAVYSSASLTDRQAAHRALADSTENENDADRRAWHRALGSPGPDEEIAESLERSAGRARARGGFAAEAALLARSAALTGEPFRRADRLLAAANAHLEAGSFEAAAGLLASAEAMNLDEMQRARVDLVRARHASFDGDARDVANLLLRAAKRLETIDGDTASLTYLHAMAGATLVGGLGHGAGMYEIAEAATSCPLPPTPTVQHWLVAGLAQLAVNGPAAAAPALRSALEATPTDRSNPQAIHMSGYLLGAATALFEGDAFHEFAAIHVSSARELGSLSMLPTALNTLAQALVFVGDLDGSAIAIAEARQIAEATGTDLLPSVSALLAGLRGDDGAEAAIADQIAVARTSHRGLAFKSGLWATATLHNGSGRYQQALAAATEAAAQPWGWNSQVFVHEFIEAAQRCGQRVTAMAVLERLTAYAEASGSDWAMGMQYRSKALLVDDDTVEDLYREAINRLSRTAIRPELARAHLLYGEWLRQEDRRIDARAQLHIAHEMFSAMGINAFAERTRHELLATGETVRKRAVDTFAELTSQEAHIARLAADGRTNPEIGAQLFISARTVEWHLRKVFTKLNVSSRRELGEALPRQALRLASS